MMSVPYDDAVRAGRAAEMARTQATAIAADLEKQGGYAGLADKKIIAMVAYLQRLGTDISNTAAPTPAPAATSTPAAAPQGKPSASAAK